MAGSGDLTKNDNNVTGFRNFEKRQVPQNVADFGFCLFTLMHLLPNTWLSGPCSADEVFFPQGENQSSGIGSCYYINHSGKTRFHETNQVCLDSSSRGSLRSPFSGRDPEFNLLVGALNYLYIFTNDTPR